MAWHHLIYHFITPIHLVNKNELEECTSIELTHHQQSYSDIMTSVTHCVGPCSASRLAARLLSARLEARPYSACLLSDLSSEQAGGSPSLSLAEGL